MRQKICLDAARNILDTNIDVPQSIPKVLEREGRKLTGGGGKEETQSEACVGRRPRLLSCKEEMA